MEETSSILVSIKKMLGITAEYTHFDADIVMHINSAFMVLFQLGVGPESYTISDDSATWEDYLGEQEGVADFQAVKSYVYLKVRLLFDPPTSSFLIDSINNQLKELEWRFTVRADEISDSSN